MTVIYDLTHKQMRQIACHVQNAIEPGAAARKAGSIGIKQILADKTLTDSFKAARLRQLFDFADGQQALLASEFFRSDTATADTTVLNMSKQEFNRRTAKQRKLQPAHVNDD